MWHTGLLLYLLDVTFRLAQQSFPVRLHLGSVDASGQLGQIHLRMDPAYPMQPLQVACTDACSVTG